MFSWYKYLIVSLVFSHLGSWSGSLFLIVPFPDLCLFVLSTLLISFVFETKTKLVIFGPFGNKQQSHDDIIFESASKARIH